MNIKKIITETLYEELKSFDVPEERLNQIVELLLVRLDPDTKRKNTRAAFMTESASKAADDFKKGIGKGEIAKPGTL